MLQHPAGLGLSHRKWKNILDDKAFGRCGTDIAFLKSFSYVKPRTPN